MKIENQEPVKFFELNLPIELANMSSKEIARRCNSFDALVEACEQAVRCVQNNNNQITKECFENLLSTLKLAKGE